MGSLLAQGAQLSKRNSELDISPFVKKVWKAVPRLRTFLFTTELFSEGFK